MAEKLAIEGGVPVRSRENLVHLSRVTFGYEELKSMLGVFEQGIFCETYPAAKFTRQFEKEFAERIGVKHAIVFNAETNAQQAALAAIGVGPGDEVIVPSLTFASTAYTVLIQNAKPIFADTGLETFNIDPKDVEKKITKRTKAIVPVHWFGNPADMDPLLELAKKHGITIIEDCAHAIDAEYKGRKVGTIGHMGCFSFQETKCFTTGGDGGMLVTNDDELAAKVRMAKEHGWLPRGKNPDEPFGPYQIVMIANLYRVSEFQSAFGLAQLRRLDYFYSNRKELSEYYDKHLKDVEGIIRQDRSGNVKQSYLYYPVRFDSEVFTKDGTAIASALLWEGVEAFPELAELTHVQPLFTQKIGYGTQGCPYKCPYYDGDPVYGWGTLPKSEKVAKELVLLPLHPGLSKNDLDDVIIAIKKVCNAYRK